MNLELLEIAYGIKIERSSHLELFYKNGALVDFLKFIGKHLCLSLFFNDLNKCHWETVIQSCSTKMSFLKISQNSGKHLCWTLFFNKITRCRPATLLNRLRDIYFPVKLTLWKSCERLFLKIIVDVGNWRWVLTCFFIVFAWAWDLSYMRLIQSRKSLFTVG